MWGSPKTVPAREIKGAFSKCCETRILEQNHINYAYRLQEVDIQHNSEKLFAQTDKSYTTNFDQEPTYSKGRMG